MKFLRVLLPVLAVSLMVLIFMFSAADSDESSASSTRVGYLLGHWFVSGFDQLDEAEQLEYIESITYPVRKAAHTTEYFFLGILCTASLLVWVRKRSYVLFLTGWGIAVLYAVSDEIHQIFVPGRACMFTDVLIDSAGAAAGVLILYIIFKIRCVNGDGSN